MTPIPIRAHHGMCYAFFRGQGYSDGFTAHMAAVQKLLEADPIIEVRNHGDVVCAQCPNFCSGRCNTPEKVLGYDNQVLALCGLTTGARLRWTEFSQLVQKQILLPGKREAICGDCQWSSLCK